MRHPLVQGCTLECDARGLPHLAAPLLTRAISRPPPPPTPVAWAERPGPSSQASAAAAAGVAAMAALPTPAAGEKRSAAAAAGWGSGEEEPPAAKRLRVWRSAAEAAAGAGVLSVVETRIRVSTGVSVELPPRWAGVPGGINRSVGWAGSRCHLPQETPLSRASHMVLLRR